MTMLVGSINGVSFGRRKPSVVRRPALLGGDGAFVRGYEDMRVRTGGSGEGKGTGTGK